MSKIKGAKCPKCMSEDWHKEDTQGYDGDYHSIEVCCMDCEHEYWITYKAIESESKEEI